MTYDILADAERIAADYVNRTGVNVEPVKPTRKSADPRGPFACPTCDEGYVTIETARLGRCRECVKGGL